MNWNPIVDKYEELEKKYNLLPRASCCLRGVRNCTDKTCSVGTAMLKVIEEYGRVAP